MSTDLATHAACDIVERVVIAGDLSKLTPQERVEFYRATCQSLGLNPLTRPFEYVTLSSKLTLYARKDCAEQLRQIRNVSLRITARELLDDCYTVTASAKLPSGREDESTGVVSLAGLKGEAKANALMKAETKAKRRVTLSICGLGMLDETEVDATPDARRVHVNQETGEILEHPKVQSHALSPAPAPAPDTERFDRYEQDYLTMIADARTLADVERHMESAKADFDPQGEHYARVRAAGIARYRALKATPVPAQAIRDAAAAVGVPVAPMSPVPRTSAELDDWAAEAAAEEQQT